MSIPSTLIVEAPIIDKILNCRTTNTKAPISRVIVQQQVLNVGRIQVVNISVPQQVPQAGGPLLKEQNI